MPGWAETLIGALGVLCIVVLLLFPRKLGTGFFGVKTPEKEDPPEE